MKNFTFKTMLMLIAILFGSTAIAQTVIFNADFDDVTGSGGNDGKFSGNIATAPLNTYGGWALTKVYKGDKCLKFGAASAQGSAQTPALADLSGNATLTFKAAAWDSSNEQTDLLLEIEGGGTLSESIVKMGKGAFTPYTVEITDGTSETKITFKGKQAKNARFFLDDVKVETASEEVPSITYCSPSFTNVGNVGILMYASTTGALTNLLYNNRANGNNHNAVGAKPNAVIGNQIEASTGSEISLNLFIDTWWGTAYVYADTDANGEFSSSEKIGRWGYSGTGEPDGSYENHTDGSQCLTNGLAPTFIVPSNMKEGSIFRVRVILGNSEESTACGTWKEGSYYDFEVKVVATPPVVKHAVTYTSPEGATVEVYNGIDLVASGTKVEEGTELTVKVTVTDETKVVDVVKANDAVLTTDGDGNYKFTLNAATNVEVTLKDAPVAKYAVTYTSPEGASVEVYNGIDLVTSGTEIEKGTELTVKVAVTDETKVIDTVKANDTELTVDGDGNYKFTLTTATNVEVTLKDAPVAKYAVTIIADEGVTFEIKKGDTVIDDLTTIDAGSELSLTFTALPAGKKIVSVAIGEQILTANEDGAYLFTVNGATEITVTLADIITYTVTLPETVENGTLTVMDGETALTPGANSVTEGTTLVITATSATGYEIASLQVAGEDFTSGETYTVNADAVITVSFQIEGPKAVLVPAKQGNNKFQFRFDDKVLGDHVNGTNNEWNGGNVTGSDHRARSFTMSVWVNPIGTEGQIFGHGQAPYYGAEGSFGIWLKDGKMSLKARCWENGGDCPGSVNLQDVGTLQTGEWAFLTVAINDINKTIKLYKNGKLLATGNLEKNGIGLLADESVFFVGNGTPDVTDGLSCYVDEVQLWNKVLTDKEIKESIKGGYLEGNMPQELIAYYKITGNSSAELENKGSYGACPAGVVSGTLEQHYESPYWGAWVYTCDFVDAKIVAGHTFPTYNLTITQPTEGGTFKIVNAKNEEISAGPVDQFTALTIVPQPANGYKLKEILVNDEPIEGTTFVLEEDSEVKVTFTNKLTLHYTVSEGGTMIVTDGNDLYADGDEFDNDLPMMITQLNPTEGYDISTFIVNGEDKKAELQKIDDSYSYVIMSPREDLTFEGTFAKKTFKVTYNTPASGNGTLTVKDGSANVESDSSVDYGTELTVTVKASGAATLTSFTVNGVERMNDLKNDVLKITVDQELTLNATFAVEEYNLSWTISGAGTIAAYDSDNGDAEIVQDGKVVKGHWVRMDITPDAENELTGLKLNDEVISLKDNENLEFADDHYEYWFEMTSDNKVSVTFQPVSSVGNTSIDGISVVYRSGMLYVNGMVEGDQINIYDVAGNYVRTSELTETNVSDLTDGCYLVKVSTVSGSKTVKFIK